jgi:hypothetical protein
MVKSVLFSVTTQHFRASLQIFNNHDTDIIAVMVDEKMRFAHLYILSQ